MGLDDYALAELSFSLYTSTVSISSCNADLASLGSDLYS